MRLPTFWSYPADESKVRAEDQGALINSPGTYGWTCQMPRLETRPHEDPVAQTSLDVLADRLEAFQGVLMEIFTVGNVDVEKLRAVLGDVVEERKEARNSQSCPEP